MYIYTHIYIYKGFRRIYIYIYVFYIHYIHIYKNFIALYITKIRSKFTLLIVVHLYLFTLFVFLF